MESSNFPPEVTPSQNTLAPQALSMPIGVRLENIAEFEVYSSSVLEQPVIAKDSYFYSTPWFKFTGMDPNAKYQLSLRFDKVSNGRFHFIRDAKKWIEKPNENATNTNISPEKHIYLHPNTFSGQRFMSEDVVFEVPMSNSSSCLRKGAVVLESSYKYQAVLLVSKIVEQGTTVQLDTPQEFRFDCMTFIVVHKYRNPEIFKMKAHPKGCKRKSRSAIEVPSSTTLFSIASLISPDETKNDSVTSAPAAPVNFQFPIGPTSFASSATLLLPNWTNKTLLENAGSDHLQPYNTPSCTGSSEDISNQYDSAVAVLLSTQPHLPSGTSSSNISFPLGPRSFAAFSPFFPSNCIFPFAPPGNFK
ncbi:Protein CBG14447 [Caenorhabditis briggsae]|uniref:Protein CBG14447 n=1 Tax=Caenorhabditis briggsae TaxID=6238 RepID=A8XJZ4_CAEBR|nr:Protein CBG14447 [Caenorhabditis briggsae]CAP32970.1 Protein CBG14447 [Caenorhabditis briggsae]